MTAWAILTAGAAIALYILIGYPILLAVVRFKPGPAVRKDLGYSPTVTAIMAVYNGAAQIRAKLDTMLALDYPKERLETIVVSDGSTDATESIVKEYADRGVQLIAAPHRGKATALNLAFEKATGEVLFFTDVRQPLDPMALRHLAANFADPTVGAVTGEMRILKGEAGEQADMDLYWRYEVWARQKQSRIDSIFNTTGCIYAMRRALARPIPADTLSDDAALPLLAFFKGYRVIFDPEAIAVDYPAVAGTEFRRRFRNLAGLWQTFVRYPQLFSSKDRMRFHFLSHKFGRLVLPWAILMIAAGTLLLPEPGIRWWLTGAEAFFLLLAAMDGLLPKGFPLKRISSPARTFLAMNAASLAGIAVFFIEPTSLWRPTRVKKYS
ncbi:MAG TPA: glycosyltransferase family 2 protein [Bryobacteraceae bacterium]|jgi:biofilm PGA synthesis N-glycosyltransferase PgaC|nr:glycosyltransferase family 2 protein [Bryobacteraceae bacterium]